MSTTETEMKISGMLPVSMIQGKLTTHASVVGLDVGLLDLAILNDQGVALAAVVTENGGGIEVEVESLGEGAIGVSEEADL